VKRYLITFSNQQNKVLESVRNFLSNLEEEKKLRHHQISLPPRPEPAPAKSKSRKKDKRKSRDWQGAASSRNSRSASPDSAGEEADQVFLAYFSPGPENFPGHVEEYDVLCPPSSPEDIEEDNMEEDLTAREQDSERDAYFAKLQLLTKEKNDRIIEVLKKRRLKQRKKKCLSHIPEVADRKYRQQNFLQSCLNSPPHLRRRPPAPRPAPATKPAAPLDPPPPPPPITLETRMGTRSRSPSIATRIGQLDGTCDIDIQEEDNSNIFKVDQTVHGDMRDKLEYDQQLRERIQLRDSLRKRREELLTEVSQLQTRKLELQHIKEVSNINNEDEDDNKYKEVSNLNTRWLE